MRNQHKFALGLLLAISINNPTLAAESADSGSKAAPPADAQPAASEAAAAPPATTTAAPTPAAAPAPAVSGDYKTHMEAGKAAAKKSDNAKALAEFQAALQLAENANDMFGVADASNEIANSYMAVNDIEHAAEYAKRAKDTAIKLLFKDPKTQALANQLSTNEKNGSIWISHVMQAEFAAQRKDYIAAEKEYEAAIAKAKEYAAEGMPMATAMTGLGKTYVAAGKYQEAEPVLRKAIELCEKNWTPVTKNAADDGADAMGQLAIALEKTGRKPEADKLKERAKQLRETKSFK